MDVELVDRRVLDLEALALHPAADLLGGDLLAAAAGVADQRRVGLDHVEVAALEVAGGDQVVDRDVVLEVEAKGGRVLAAPPRAGHLADHRAERRHEARVARVDAVGQLVAGLEHVDGDAGVTVGVEELAVLAQRQVAVEHVALAQRVAHERRVLRVLLAEPAERARVADEDVAQDAELAGRAPVVEAGAAAALDAGAERRGGGNVGHRGSPCYPIDR